MLARALAWTVALAGCYDFSGLAGGVRTVPDMACGPHVLRFTGGPSQALELGDVDPFRFDLDDEFTIEAWVWNEEGSKFAVLSKNYGRDSFYLFGVNDPTLVAEFGLRYPVSAFHVDGDAVPYRAWTHVAFTYDGSRSGQGVKMYVDGAPSSLDVQGNMGSMKNSAPAYVGRTDGLLNKGMIDELRVWNRVRTASQIAGARRSCLGAEEGLVAYYTFDHCDGKVARNAVPGGPDGTIVEGMVPVEWVAAAPGACR